VRRYGVYLGDRSVLWDDVRILPVVDFLKQLWAGEILTSAAPEALRVPDHSGLKLL